MKIIKLQPNPFSKAKNCKIPPEIDYKLVVYLFTIISISSRQLAYGNFKNIRDKRSLMLEAYRK
jgi:hypothetical protein